MISWNDSVKELCSQVGTKHNVQCTGFIQQRLMYMLYGWDNKFACPSGYPIDYLKGLVSDVYKYFEVIPGAKEIKYGDILIWEKFNYFGHSAIALEDIVINKSLDSLTCNCLSGNYGGSLYNGDKEQAPMQISVKKHHLHGFSGLLRPIENTLPKVCLDSVKAEDNVITVSGWAFDRKNLNVHCIIHAYIIENGSKLFLDGTLTNQVREDVNKAYRITGTHGFNQTIITNLVGDYEVLVACIDTVDSSKHTWSASKKVTLTAPYKPKIGDRVLCLAANDIPDEKRTYSDGKSTFRNYGKGIEVEILDISKSERATFKIEIKGFSESDLSRFTDEEFIEEIKD